MSTKYTVRVHVSGAEPTDEGELTIDATPAFESSAPDLLRRWMNAIAGAMGQTVVLRLRNVDGVEGRLVLTPVSADAAHLIRSNEHVSIMIDSVDLDDMRAGNGTIHVRPRW